MSDIKRDILVCECNSLEHQFAIWYDEVYNQVYIEPHLNRRPLLDRIKYAIKYVLGRQSNYGAFDEIIIKPIDADKIIEYLQKYKRD